MTHYLCVTCGTQFAPTTEAPEACPICEDERQYIGSDGQQWTTMDQLQQGHRNCFKQIEPRLYGVGTEPKFAIGQRALLIQAESEHKDNIDPASNILWDCVSLLDDETIAQVNKLGGLGAIAVSHPHYYAASVAWAKAFDAPLYLHEADRQWVMRPDPIIEFWSGETLALRPDVTLIRAGGHFRGGTVCHWANGSNEEGALLTGDVIQVVADQRWVSFMYSYPNLIPLSAAKVRRIEAAVSPHAFKRLYGAWWHSRVQGDAKACIRRSADRYIQALQAEPAQ